MNQLAKAASRVRMPAISITARAAATKNSIAWKMSWPLIMWIEKRAGGENLSSSAARGRTPKSV